ncbi:MAG: hypothetical protein J3K34DRAFT_469467 [Monoraphidium minutum]|nr:MAG: hypothetical protein J3K34DRAFT_469467 [Monoraphidium minutum]
MSDSAWPVSWAAAQCKQAKTAPAPGVDPTFSGCYPNNPAFWRDWAGIQLTDGVEFCTNFPRPLPPAPANLDFEAGTLDGWTVSPDSPRKESVTVECNEADPAHHCYATLSTEGTDGPDITIDFVTPPNALSRSDLAVFNGGGCNNAPWVVDMELRFAANDIFWDDRFFYYVAVRTVAIDGTVSSDAIAYDSIGVIDVGPFANSGWYNWIVDIGSPPPGTKLAVEVWAGISNDLKVNDMLTSYAAIDNVRLRLAD